MRFEFGFDLQELREYWKRSGYDGNLDYLMSVVTKGSSQLTVGREDNKVVGQAVLRESKTGEHRKGRSIFSESPRSKFCQV